MKWGDNFYSFVIGSAIIAGLITVGYFLIYFKKL